MSLDYRSRTSVTASSTRSISSMVRKPIGSAKRLRSTVASWSHMTRVCRSAMTTDGRKLGEHLTSPRPTRRLLEELHAVTVRQLLKPDSGSQIVKKVLDASGHGEDQLATLPVAHHLPGVRNPRG